LAIGYNGAPVGVPGEEVTLRYADDDAASFYQFARDFSSESRLLTVMDPDTQSRFPAEVSQARPPTLAQLRAEVQTLARLIDDDRKRGDESAVLVLYSGHGVRPRGGPPGFTLLDATLTHDALYDEVLAALPARYIHLFIDACYAEAIVRPRDAEAVAVDLTRDDLAQYAAKSTLARFPNVGAIMGASSSSQTHEWDVYRQGVFTHELLSGLRGGADVNSDGKIEYSELYAFLAAANRNVADARARLSVVARPPASNGRAAIVDLFQPRSLARIVKIPASAGQVYLEDAVGNRLADLRVERGAQVGLTLPVDKKIYIRTSEGEADFVLRPAQTLAFEQLTMTPPAERTRGAMDVAMRRGLFATGFGPSYYRGFIDQTSTFVSVPLDEPPAPDVVEPKQRASSPRTLALYVAPGATAAITSGIGPLLALRAGLRPADASGWVLDVDTAIGQATITEGRVLATAGYRFGIRAGRFSASAGLVGGAGVAWQKSSGGRGLDGWTPAFVVSPSGSAAFRLTDHVGIAFETALSMLLFRADGQTELSRALPAAYLGAITDL
jgi:hypothetical protein